MSKDPYRIKKDEFLHRLHEDHKMGGPVGSLDVGEMTAAKMYLTAAMRREGIILSAGETVNMVGEMAKAIGGDTTLAGQQIVSQKDYEMRLRKIGNTQRRNQDKARALLMNKNRR